MMTPEAIKAGASTIGDIATACAIGFTAVTFALRIAAIGCDDIVEAIKKVLSAKAEIKK